MSVTTEGEMVRLDEAAIERALPAVSIGLGKYLQLQAALPTTDVTRDLAFQTKFNAFYRVRRGESWRVAFYRLLRQQQSRSQPFGAVLRQLYEATGRVEASFTSKLVATVDPDQPVVDSFVLRNVGLRLPLTGTVVTRLTKIDQLHGQLACMFSDFLASPTGSYLVRRFAESYPGRRLTAIKMLDLVLWQTRQDADPGAVPESAP